MTKTMSGWMISLAVAGLLAGCGDSSTETAVGAGGDTGAAATGGDTGGAATTGGDTGPLELIGTWESTWGEVFEVTDAAWGGFALGQFSNLENWAVTQAPADDAYNPSKWSRLVWTDADEFGDFWYCTVDFGLDSQDAAVATEKVADDSDPANGGCGGVAWTQLRAWLPIAGAWANDFGMEEHITSFAWDGATIIEHEIIEPDGGADAQGTVYTQLAADDPYNPSKFERRVWVSQTGAAGMTVYYCTEAFGQDTLEAAKTADGSADVTDLETGCAGFPWTQLVPAIEVAGTWWSAAYAFEVTISSFAWGTEVIVEYDNAANVAYTQLPEDDPYNPSKFTKTVWTELEDGSFWYCTADYGLETLDAAKASDKTADDADPATGGCGGFPWTALGPKPE